MRSRRGSIISPLSTIARASIPSNVPQSISEIITSWATSTSLRVRYPESAVFNAVSARPLRAPWVEIKYCRTVSPSRKFAVIGVSIISPDGFAIKPRIPASCRICCLLPLAPESAIIKTGLKELLKLSLSSISLNIASAILSVTSDQRAIILFLRSPYVIAPARYCCSTAITSASACLTSPFFSFGMTRSSIPMDSPDFVA